MTITSAGYYGTINDVQWAQLFEPLPHWFRFSAFVPSAVAGARTVSLTAGVAFGAGIRDTSDIATTIALTPPSSGGQWFLVVLRRIWSIGVAGATSVQALAGPTTAGTVPTAPPSTAPGTLQQTPSATDDAPVAWVHVRAADTTLTIFDARMILDSNGRASAASSAALAVLPLISPLPGGLRVFCLADGIEYRWNGTTWRAWDSDWLPWTGIGYDSGTGGNAGSGSTLSGQYRYRGGRVLFEALFSYGASGSTPGSYWKFSLPVFADATNWNAQAASCSVAFLNASESYRRYYGSAYIESAGLIHVHTLSANGASNEVTGNNPFGETWSNQDQIRLTAEYDPA